MRKNRFPFGRLLFAIIMVIVLYSLITGYIRLRTESSKSFVSFPKITNTYAEIFSKEVLNNLEPDLTFFSKGTNPVATLKDKRDQARILVFKFDFHTRPELKKAFEISDHIESPQTGIVYNSTRIINGFDIFRTTVPVTFKKMILSFKAEQTVKTAQNDSLICFRMHLKDFSLSEKETGKMVIHMKSKNVQDEPSYSQMLLLQKENAVYLLFKNESSAKSRGLNLYNLFIK